MRRFFSISLLTLAPQIVFAATGTAASESLLIPTLKMLGALGIVVGLLLLLYAASRKGFGFLPKAKDGKIQMLETRALGGKKFLCLVRVHDQELLLGVSNDRIECLTTFSGGEMRFSSTLERAELASTPDSEGAQ